MAIHIQSGKNSVKWSSKTKVQSVPFRIHADCDAKVSEYFDSCVKRDENDVLSGSFRGYPLKGKEIVLPEGYIGTLLHESIRPLTDKDDRKFYVVNDFNRIIYWNWDKVPSKNDTFSQALDWIDIAEALHSPVVEE